MIERFRCDLWNAIRLRWYTEARSAGEIFTVARLELAVGGDDHDKVETSAVAWVIGRGYRGLRRPCRVSPAASAARASLRKLPRPSSFPRVLSNVSLSRVVYDGFGNILNHLFCWNDVIN
jgi:hypothetical protein